jgi:hypothetical protein
MRLCTPFYAAIRRKERWERREEAKKTYVLVYEVVSRAERQRERVNNMLVLLYLNVNATVHVVSYSAGLKIYFRPSHAGGAPARVH